jgi:myo-inositol 2-dehydrogenase / D-chiro-inositol 1-dehydrogenase
MSIGIGVIGAGIMGADHARTIDRFVSGAHVAVIADVDSARAQEAADAVGATSTADARALIGDPAVDAVLIASHDSTHAALSLAAIEAGKPVLCEKPLAPTVADCERILAAEAATGRSLVTVGFMRRFDPGYVQLKAALQAGDVGAPLLVHSVGRGVSSGPGSTSESSVTNSAVHDLDIVPWLLDSPVVEASWQAGRPTRNADGFQDPQLILLRTADGTLSTVETLLNARYGYDVRCEMVCENGILELSEPARTVQHANLGRTTGYAADWRPRFADAYRLEVQAWVDGLDGREAVPLASSRDGLQSLLVAEAVIASMHAGGRFVAVAAGGVPGT